MSRYTLQPRQQTVPRITVVVGWDNPMRTFFAQVYQEPPANRPEDGPQELVWVGLNYDEIKTLEPILQAVAPWADISQEIQQKLLTDQGQGASYQASPLQGWVENLAKQMND